MVPPAPLQIYENPFQIMRLALHDTPHLNMKQKPNTDKLTYHALENANPSLRSWSKNNV